MQACVDTLNTTPYSAVNFSRGTYADGAMLQDKVFQRFRDSDMYLASAIDANSTDVSSIYEELEHLKAASDVIAVYGTFSAFSAQSGDLGYLSDKDIIKVLKDETVSANQTYYQYNTSTSSWNFICSLEPYYSITESDSISSYLNDRINTKVDQTAFDTYSAVVSADLSAIHTDLSKKLYTSAFNAYSENVNTQLQTLSSTKLDKSTFSAYQNTVTQQFSAVNTELDKKLYTSATSNWDVTPYSGNDNVSVKNHVISLSGKSELVGDNKNIAVVEQGSNTVVSAMKDFVDLVTVNSAITSAISSKLDTSTFNTYKNTTNTQISALSVNKLDVSVFTNSAAHFKHIQTASTFVASSNNQAIVALTQTENGNVSAKFGTVAPNVNVTAIGTAGTATSATSSYLSVQSAEDAQTNTKTFNLTFDPSEALTSWWRIRGSSYTNDLAQAKIYDYSTEGGNHEKVLQSPFIGDDNKPIKYLLLPYMSDSTSGANYLPIYNHSEIAWRDDYRYAHVVAHSDVSNWHITFKKVDVLPDTLENNIYYLI